MTQFDEASIAKLKVVELKQELEKLNVEIPKGAKKADLAALLRSVTIEAVKEDHDSLVKLLKSCRKVHLLRRKRLMTTSKAIWTTLKLISKQ